MGGPRVRWGCAGLLTVALLLGPVPMASGAAAAVQASPWQLGGRLGAAHDQTRGGPRRSSLGLRLQGSRSTGGLALLGAVDTTFAAGDLAFAQLDFTGGVTPLLDLSKTWVDGERRLLTSRVDRLSLSYEAGRTRFRLGRDALSLGQGLVFQPLDTFGPFSPTQIDTDYKTGVDLAEVVRVFDDGAEVAIVGVGRRADGEFSVAASSLSLRGRRLVGALELSAFAGRHVGDSFAAFGASGPLGAFLWRFDVQLTETVAGTRWSGVANADLSFSVGERPAYAFLELHRNGFGAEDLEGGLAAVLARDPDLAARLGRGELFTLQRHYGAVGGQFEWHPLWTQTALLIASFDDSSALLQNTLGFVPDDAQLFEASLLLPLGPAGTEYGGVFLDPDGTTVLGGEPRILLRYARYF